MIGTLQGILRQLKPGHMVSRQARTAFRLLDQLFAAQAAIDAGSNPNRQLFIESLFAKTQRELGEAWLDDSIQAKRGASLHD